MAPSAPSLPVAAVERIMGSLESENAKPLLNEVMDSRLPASLEPMLGEPEQTLEVTPMLEPLVALNPEPLHVIGTTVEPPSFIKPTKFELVALAEGFPLPRRLSIKEEPMLELLVALNKDCFEANKSEAPEGPPEALHIIETTAEPPSLITPAKFEFVAHGSPDPFVSRRLSMEEEPAKGESLVGFELLKVGRQRYEGDVGQRSNLRERMVAHIVFAVCVFLIGLLHWVLWYMDEDEGVDEHERVYKVLENRQQIAQYSY